MAIDHSTGVKDIPADVWIAAMAKHLKATGKVTGAQQSGPAAPSGEKGRTVPSLRGLRVHGSPRRQLDLFRGSCGTAPRSGPRGSDRAVPWVPRDPAGLAQPGGWVRDRQATLARGWAFS